MAARDKAANSARSFKLFSGGKVLDFDSRPEASTGSGAVNSALWEDRY